MQEMGLERLPSPKITKGQGFLTSFFMCDASSDAFIPVLFSEKTMYEIHLGDETIEFDGEVKIDKTIITNVPIEDILDPIEYINSNEMIVESDPKYCCMTNSGFRFRSIRLKKTDAYDLYVNAAHFQGTYSEIQLSVNRNDGLFNLIGSTPDELRDNLESAEKYLREIQGIAVDFRGAKVKKMELAKTFVLDYPVEEYKYVFDTMINLMPKNSNFRHEEIRNDVSALNKSGSEKVKMYDKKNELKNVHSKEINEDEDNDEYDINDIEEEIMRFEVVFENKNGSLKKKLKNTYVTELKQENIDCIYNAYIKKNFIKPFEKHLDFQTKTVEKLLKREYKKDSHEWIDNVLHYINNYELENQKPLMFEITQMKKWLNCLNLDKQNKYNIYKRFEKKSKKYLKHYQHNTIEKYQEILTKIQ